MLLDERLQAVPNMCLSLLIFSMTSEAVAGEQVAPAAGLLVTWDACDFAQQQSHQRPHPIMHGVDLVEHGVAEGEPMIASPAENQTQPFMMQ